MLGLNKVTLIGLGLIGSSIARAAEEALPGVMLSGFDADRKASRYVAALDLASMAETIADAVRDADLVILCVPVGAMAEAAESIAPHLKEGAIVSDVGSSKAGIAADLERILPTARVVPAHPVAGTENSGPEAGFAALFRGRWCILTPGDRVDEAAIAIVRRFWEKLGAK